MSNIVKNTTFPNFLDLIIPHTCRGCGRIGASFCDCCKNNLMYNYENYCPNCKKLNPTGNCKKCKTLPPTFVAGKRSEILGDLIHDLKYHSCRALAKPLSEIFNYILPIIDGRVIIVPLPTIKSHIRQRGLDHTYLISQHLAKLRGKNYSVKRLLVRKTNTVQVGSDQKTRKEQAEKTYALLKNSEINPEITYLLLDDVWTTGASMKSALKKLRENGAQKIIITTLTVNRL